MTKARILVVDDDDVVRLSYAASLAGAYDIGLAASGAQALEDMQRAPADVVLLDLRMPGAGGLDVLADLKQRWPESEVVIITGFPCVDTAKEAVRRGAFDYLAKPVDPDDVVGATRNALTHKRWTLRSNPSRRLQ